MLINTGSKVLVALLKLDMKADKHFKGHKYKKNTQIDPLMASVLYLELRMKL